MKRHESAGLDMQTAPYGLLLLRLALGAMWISHALLPILVTAAWVRFPNGWVFTGAGGGWEYPVFLAVASMVHAFAGDGAFSVKLPRLHFARSAT